MYRLALVALVSLSCGVALLSSCGFLHSGPNVDRIRREEHLAKYAGAVPVDSIAQWNSKSIPRRFDFLKTTILEPTWMAFSHERVCIIPDWMVRYIEHGDRPQCVWYSPHGV